MEADHARLSLSYDNGATFRVIKSMIGGCPLTSTYGFTIPSYVPNGNALLAWTWQNFVGNREFYMNCAEVHVVSHVQNRSKRQSFNTFDSLPYIWKANLVGVNECITEESVTPVYPHSGPDVEYSAGMTSSDAPSPGQCDLPTPHGDTYQDLGDSDSMAGSTSDESATSVTSPQSFSPSTKSISDIVMLVTSTETASVATTSRSSPSTALTTSIQTISLYSTTLFSNVNLRMPADSTKSTTTVTVDCLASATVTVTVTPSSHDSMSTVTTTLSPSVYTTSAAVSACTGTSASCPCAVGYGCSSIAACEWACYASPTSTLLTLTMTTTSTSTSVLIVTTTATAVSGTVSSSSRISLSPASSLVTLSSLPASSAGDSPSSTSMSVQSTVYAVSTATVSPVPASPATQYSTATASYTLQASSSSSQGTPFSQSSQAPQPSQPPYASGDVEAYLPCVPGTFICTSNSTWETCDYNDGSVSNAATYVYDYPRNVSAGMECISYLSPYSNQTLQYAQQAITPQGYYRDDRVVRARPDGDCTQEGSIMCTDGGQQFDVCDNGGYVQMGPVANGTTCENGQIVAS